MKKSPVTHTHAHACFTAKLQYGDLSFLLHVELFTLFKNDYVYNHSFCFNVMFREK